MDTAIQSCRDTMLSGPNSNDERHPRAAIVRV